MMKQEISKVGIASTQDQLKVRALTQSDPNPEREDSKIYLSKIPIFRIDADCFHLVLNINDPQNQVHSRLFHNTKIRPHDREKLKSWMLSETQNMYDRQTYALTSKYLDLYFSRGNKVQRNAFQILGLACLILAAKVNQRRIPNISFQVFSRQQIFHFQQELLKIFKFKVTFITYVPVAQLLLAFWDYYQCERHPFQDTKYFKQGIESIKNVRSVMETLDCADLNEQTLDIKMINLIYCVFFIQNRRICLMNTAKKQDHKQNCIQTEDEHQFATIYQKFMANFMQALKSSVVAFSEVQLQQKVLFYLMNFSRINPKIQVNKKYKHFAFEMTRQTYNPQITEIAQRYMSKTIN